MNIHSLVNPGSLPATIRPMALLQSSASDGGTMDRIATALGVLAVVGVAVLVGVMVARTWITGQWYVAVNGSAGTGTVAIYQGVPGSLLGVPLSSLTSDSGLEVGTLPLFDQELVSKSIPATSQTDAERIVTELQGRSAQCQTAVPPAGCPGAPS